MLVFHHCRRVCRDLSDGGGRGSELQVKVTSGCSQEETLGVLQLFFTLLRLSRYDLKHPQVVLKLLQCTLLCVVRLKVP